MRVLLGSLLLLLTLPSSAVAQLVTRVVDGDTIVVAGVGTVRLIGVDTPETVDPRKAATRHVMKRSGIVRARRPKYLFSGLTRCASCGGGFTLSSHDHLICFNAHSRGTCTNLRSIKRQEVEARALRAMKELFFEPGAFSAFCEGFAAEMTRQRREHLAQRAGARRELATVEREIRDLIQSIKNGVSGKVLAAESLRLEHRKTVLEAALAEPPLPALHPNMSDVFREQATTLAAGLEHDEHRDAARQALRGFLDRIEIPPGDGLLKVVGNVGAMLVAAHGRAKGATASVGYVGCGGTQPTLSAALAPCSLTFGRSVFTPRFLGSPP